MLIFEILITIYFLNVHVLCRFGLYLVCTLFPQECLMFIPISKGRSMISVISRLLLDVFITFGKNVTQDDGSSIWELYSFFLIQGFSHWVFFLERFFKEAVSFGILCSLHVVAGLAWRVTHWCLESPGCSDVGRLGSL